MSSLCNDRLKDMTGSERLESWGLLYSWNLGALSFNCAMGVDTMSARNVFCIILCISFRLLILFLSRSMLSLTRNSHLKILQDATKVGKEYLVIGAVAVFVILIFFGVGAGVLCSIVGFLYPSFKSFEAIESKNKGEDIQVRLRSHHFFSRLGFQFLTFLLYLLSPSHSLTKVARILGCFCLFLLD